MPPLRQALPQFADGQILGEPVGRDTVNAIGFTAAVLCGREELARDMDLRAAARYPLKNGGLDCELLLASL